MAAPALSATPLCILLQILDEHSNIILLFFVLFMCCIKIGKFSLKRENRV
jgi:hypothetical protein